jgi:hypothetical protein
LVVELELLLELDGAALELELLLELDGVALELELVLLPEGAALELVLLLELDGAALELVLLLDGAALELVLFVCAITWGKYSIPTIVKDVRSIAEIAIADNVEAFACVFLYIRAQRRSMKFICLPPIFQKIK